MKLVVLSWKVKIRCIYAFEDVITEKRWRALYYVNWSVLLLSVQQIYQEDEPLNILYFVRNDYVKHSSLKIKCLNTHKATAAACMSKLGMFNPALYVYNACPKTGACNSAVVVVAVCHICLYVFRFHIGSG